VFSSYYFSTTDMDFIRLMGSIIVFGVFMLFVYIICRFLLNVKQSRLDYLIRLSIDLM
jgi:phage shock protein PspC (stress-responsive transcriptional regulator)